jgi:DNA-binding transcriptional LysR family regulator
VAANERWAGVELRHLTALRAVATERSFHRAAATLGYTQSAISQQIAMLEKITGERLIERPNGKRPVGLTEAGIVLLAHAEAITSRVALAQADFATLRQGKSGAFAIGADQSVGPRLLSALVQGFLGLHPDVEIGLSEAARDSAVLKELETGLVDVALIDLPVPGGPFETIPLVRDPYVVVVQATSALAGRSTNPTVAEIALSPLLCLKSQRHLDRLLPHLQIHNPTPEIVVRSNNGDLLQEMAAADAGVALLPRLSVRDDPRVKVLEPSPALASRLLGLAWHRERPARPVVTAFVSFARAQSLGPERGSRHAQRESPRRERRR